MAIDVTPACEARFFEALATLGRATIFGLARQAYLPVPLAYRWLEAQAQSGHVHKDPVSGRYSLWCDLDQQEGGA
jgi:hypothetical protein